MTGQTLADNGLPQPKRVITDHDQDGKTTFSTLIPEKLPFEEIKGAKGGPHEDRFCLAYATTSVPVQFNDKKDVKEYSNFLENKPGIIIRGGTVLRYVDIAPGNTSPMHRTISLDYGVVLEGEVELILDSGETSLLKRGDITIQRGTNHAWRNVSPDKWARMLYILQEAAPFSIGNEISKEDYGAMKGVRPSD